MHFFTKCFLFYTIKNHMKSILLKFYIVEIYNKYIYINILYNISIDF